MPPHRHSRSRGRARFGAIAVMLTAGCMIVGCASGPRHLGRARSESAQKRPLKLETFSGSQRERVQRAQPWVAAAADRYGLDPDLVNGVIWVESRFQVRAHSPAGAKGLMQLMPATAAELARQLEWPRPNRYDPEFNVVAGTFYLSRLIRHYDGDLRLALAAYNAGPGNVDRWKRSGKDLPGYSRKYVKMVMEAQARFAALRQGPAPRETPTLIAKAPEPATTTPQAATKRPAVSPPRPQPSTQRTVTASRSAPPKPATTQAAPTPRPTTPRTTASQPDPERARALARAYRESQERLQRARARLAAQRGGLDAPPRPAAQRDETPVATRKRTQSDEGRPASGGNAETKGLPSVLD